MKTKQKSRGVYPPKRTACLCGRPGYTLRNGWICKLCNDIENRNARSLARRKGREPSPNDKYAATFKTCLGVTV